jgi:thiamine biosynthesis lipoprotein
MSAKSTRRDFLRGKSAADAVSDAMQAGLPDSDAALPAGQPATRPYLVHVSRRAMACEFEVTCNAGQYENQTEAALDALDLVEELEGQMSVFRETSQISRVNREAAARPVTVDGWLFDLLEQALGLYDRTDGAFDITSAPLWRAWGFARRQGAVPDEQQLAEALESVGSRFVKLDREARTVRFLKSNVEINLGSIGKGYALDRCERILIEAGIGNFLLHGGQSSVLARGSRFGTKESSSEEASAGWTVGLGHPLLPGRRLAEIRLENRALATSGSAAQFFRHKGRRYSHVLDPRSGRPAEGALSVTVLGSSAALTDALATAFFVLGPEWAFEYCGSRPELAAIFVSPAAQGPGVQISSAGLRDDELKIVDPHTLDATDAG